MGASREGTMSVRESINLVLRQADPEEVTTKKTTDCDVSRPVPKIEKGIDDGGGRSGGEKVDGGGGNKSLKWNHQHQHRQPQESLANGESPESTTSLVSEAWDEDVKQQLLQNHLKLLQIGGYKLHQKEKEYKTVCLERDELQVTLQSEREERLRLEQVNASLLEQKNRTEETLKEKEKMILELQRQLLIANTPKSVKEKSTCTSPPSSPPLEGPPSKRAKFSNDENSFALPPPPETIGSQQTRLDNINNPSSSSLISFNIRRSSSPPQLSPAVTPRSLSHKNNYSGSRVKGFCNSDEDSDSENEFQCLVTPIQEADKPSSSTSGFPPKDSPISTLQRSNISRSSSSNRSDDFFYPRESTSNSHSSRLDNHNSLPNNLNYKPIQRPRPNNFFRHSVGRPMQPERRYNNNNTSSHTRSHFPGASKQLCSFSVSKNISSDNTNNFLSINTVTPSQPQQMISVRNNNFLNLSRPVPSKDLTSLISTENISSSRQENQTFRSLTDFERINEEGIPETVTSPTKKRSVGRPPGSIKKRVQGPSPAVSNPSPGPSPSNGIVEQKFSKRGRLLKPNRARYSPDPDISVNAREKCITTRKNYFMPESVAQEESECAEAEPPPTPAATVKEKEETVCPPVEVVEVPKWRLNVIEGYEDEPNRPIPDDDMSDEAFLKRHQKLEAKEKQRKRWDSQRLREETYREKLQLRQEERERQKELRRLQRKRKGRADCTSDDEQETLLPTIEDVKAVFISPELPVGAFGFTLPLVEKVGFQLPWTPAEDRNYINNTSDKNNNSSDNESSSTEMPTTTDKVLNPSPSSLLPSSCKESLPPVSSQNSILELSSSSYCSISSNSIPLIELDTTTSTRRTSLNSIINTNFGNDKCSAMNLTSSPLCRSILDANKGIVVEFDNDIEGNNGNNFTSNPSTFDLTTSLTFTEDIIGECSSPTPIFTIDLVDFRNENNNDSNGSSSGSSSSKTNASDDDNDALSRSSPSPPPTSVLPSTSNPSSSSRNYCDSSRNSSSNRTCDSGTGTSKVVDIGLLKVSCPPLSYSISNSNPSTSFKFVIPTNPLAPRQSSPGSPSRPLPVSSHSPPKPGSRSQRNVVPFPSQITSHPRSTTLNSNTADEMCKDNVRS